MVKWCHGIGLVSAISVGKPAAAAGGLAMVKWCHGMGLVSAISVGKPAAATGGVSDG